MHLTQNIVVTFIKYIFKATKIKTISNESEKQVFYEQNPSKRVRHNSEIARYLEAYNYN